MDIKQFLNQLKKDLGIETENVSILKLNTFKNLESIFVKINTSHKILYIKKGKHNQQLFTLMADKIYNKSGKKRINHLFIYKQNFHFRAEKVLNVFEGITYDTLFNELNVELFGIDPFNCYVCKNPHVTQHLKCNRCNDCNLCKECTQYLNKCPKCKEFFFLVDFQ